ncbi:MAG: hypothetical protein QNL91_03350 [Candidatus Krumholzibacteria bacterium]|nr:hypothetical protein [Candidatus Krumholzibacteria bacterium]
MDIDLNTMLVALMFVTILSMGIGNILGTMADIFNHGTTARRDRVHVAWIILLLVVHFNLFWHTKAILDVAEWTFGGFMIAMAGPVLIFLATSILLTNPPDENPADMQKFFVKLGRRFFFVFALTQVWILLAGYAMTAVFVVTDLVNVAFVILAVVLATAKAHRVQVAGIAAAWGLGLASLAIRGLNL